MPLQILASIPRLHPGRPAVQEQAALTGSFTTLRLAVRPMFPPGTPISFSVTSAQPQAGKSLVASNLALSFAEAGYRTLIVDGDAEGGRMSAAFGVPKSPGLTDYMTGRGAVDDVVFPTAYERLYVLPRGWASAGPADALRLSPLHETLCARFDIVIVDAPPLGPAAMAVTVMTTDVLVVMGDRPVDALQVELAIESKLVPRCRVLGAVVNAGAVANN